MRKLPSDQLISQREAIELAKSAVGITLHELAPPDEGYWLGLHLVDRPAPVFIAPQRTSVTARQWAKADTALSFVKHSLGFRGPVTVELAGKPAEPNAAELRSTQASPSDGATRPVDPEVRV